MNEESITEFLCSYILLKYKGAVLNRIAPSGFFKNGRMIKHRSKYIKKGVSDIQVMYRGSFYAIEVKTPKELEFYKKHEDQISMTPACRLSKKKAHLKEQQNYIKAIKAQGGKGSFVASISDIVELFR